MTTYTVRGTKRPEVEGYEPGLDRLSDLLQVDVAEDIDLSTTRADGDPPIDLNIPKDSVVQVELENGLTMWVREDEVAETLTRSTRAGQKPEIAGVTLSGPQSRGVIGWAIKGLKLLNIDIVDAAADITAVSLAGKIESLAFDGVDVKGPGLYRALTPYHLSPVAAKDIPTQKPILVFLHGTGSTTAGSFGALAGPDPNTADEQRSPFWESIRAAYGDRIFALQHRTLSDSPIRNAIELLEALPVGACLHLVSHSRGGLVGELIARAGAVRLGDDGQPLAHQPDPIDQLDMQCFEKAADLKKGSEAEKKALKKARKRDIADLKRLNDLLLEKAPRVERFVRVACPTRGTTLASGRLDKYLEIFVNLLDLVPFLKGNPIVDLTKAFMLAVVKTRTDPAVIPGLEAMMPRSPLITMLNRDDVRIEGGLSVIAGDIEPSGIFRTLAVYATDRFFPDDHDLVVDTDAMVGGAVREPVAKYFFDKGGDVNHFSYFSNERTRGRLLSALTGEGLERDKGFHTLDDPATLTVRAVPRSTLDPATAPHVFLLPGIMGSTLTVGNNRVWLDYFDMAFGGIETLDPEGPQNAMIRPGGMIDDYYRDLHAHLTETHIVHPFPYDWRKSVLENGRLLGEAVAAVEAGTRENAKPIRFVAHSMGGLVVRAMTKTMPGTWDKVRKRDGCRIVMLGTPNKGSHATMAGLIGQSETVRQLSLLDITNSREEVLRVIARIPGFLELLPWAELPVDKGSGQIAAGPADGQALQPEFWRDLEKWAGEGWAAPADTLLEAARKTHETLGEVGEDILEKLCYVAGTAPDTPAHLNKAKDTDERKKWLEVQGIAEGDGRVTWRTGVPAGLARSRLYLSQAEHGDLARHAPDFPAITDLLLRGETIGLPHLPAEVLSDDWGARFLEPARTRGLHRPGRRDLRNLPLGGARPRPPVAPQARAKVSISHGNLAFCGNVVAVGHYTGEIIVGAEHFIDSKLDGRLSKRRALGLYPGALGTGEVVLTDPGQMREAFQGALVIGLGNFGELDVEKLTQCLTYGFTLYALRRREALEAGAEENAPPQVLSTLLIGHQESRLGLRESVRAALGGLLRANAQLDPDDRITELHFVELFEDTAVAAADLLRDETENPRYRDLEIDFRLRTLGGARRRISHASDDDWVQRIEIRGSEKDSLRFTTHSDAAVAAEDLVTRNRGQIDQFIDQMTSTTSTDERVSQLLFEMLFPRAIKTIYSGGRPIQITVDEETANYPWEMLDNGFSDNAEPIAVSTSVVRQLLQSRSDLMAGPGGNRGVLVVGDPKSDFPELRGAQDEAIHVARAFQQDGRWAPLHHLDKPNGFDVQVNLLLEKHRIVHLAGHGVCEYVAPDAPPGTAPKTGMVIGPDAFLTSDLIAKMSYPPEFVFLNCCNLGRLPKLPAYRALHFRRHRLAASLAVQFMRAGARAVIAAGWEVEDKPAEAFANTFYAEMLKGKTFATAVTMGRQAAYQANPDSNTWGAYQCYGDPSFTFEGRGSTAGPRKSERPFSSLAQAIASVENISRDAKTSVYSNPEAAERSLLSKLGRLDRRLTPEWRNDPVLLATIGTAYSDLNDFANAIPNLERAVSSERSHAPIRVIATLANIRARLAVDGPIDARDKLRTEPDAKAKVQQSIREIEGLIATLQPTVERYRLLASAYKRLSMVDKYTHLRDAVAWYARALDLSQKGKDEDAFDPDPAINARLCAGVYIQYALARNSDPDQEQAIRKSLDAELKNVPGIDEIRTRLKEVRRSGKDNFWNWAMLADQRLARVIAEGRLGISGKDSPVPWILSDYDQAWKVGGNSRELSSVVETIKFIRVIWGREDRKLAQERAALRDIYDALNAFPGYNERL